MSEIDNIFSFGAQQQCESYNRIAAYKEKQAAHELLIAQAAHENVQLMLQHTHQNLQPSILMRAQITRDGDEWVASYGECQGRGPSPDLACQDFDTKWTGKSL